MRQRLYQRQQTTLRKVLVLTSSVVVLLSLALVIVINLLNNRTALAAVNGDYRSGGCGDWNNVSTWEVFNGTAWVPAVTAPGNESKIISILNGHTVTITSNVIVDHVVVNIGGFLIVNNGVDVTVADSKETDFDIKGTFKNAGNVIIKDKAKIVFESTGKYQHNFTSSPGTIPDASWLPGSSCEIIGYTTNSIAPSGLQAFENFTWNCPSQIADICLDGKLKDVKGNLTILSSGSSGNLFVGAEDVRLNVGGDFIVSGGNCELVKGNAIAEINIAGNYFQTGGTFYNSDENKVVVNISGNFSQTGGSVSQTGNGNILINFKKQGVQKIITAENCVSGNIDYRVENGSTLDLGTSILYGRNFTLSAGAGIIVGAPEGIENINAAGNIQVSGVRSFNDNADYSYNGSTLQSTGSGLPVTVHNLTINNSENVSLSNDVAVSGKLIFTNGSVITGNNEVDVIDNSNASIAGYSSSNYVIGNLRRSVKSNGSYDFPVGTTDNYEILNLNLASVKGFTSVLAKFNNTSPLVPELPLADVAVQGILMKHLVQAGYWTLSPESNLTAGTFAITVSEAGQLHAANPGSDFALLNRLNKFLPWTSVGIHTPEKQNLNCDAITASRSFLNVFGDFAIAWGKSDVFATNSPGNKNIINTFY